MLFAALTVGGESKKFYRFQSPDDGIVDYYDDGGKSAKKFLVRKPVATGIMRSGFGVRHHPILGYTKMHTGVDWAAPTGTPIFASGNGVVEKAGWESGYGKYIRLRHTNGYETAYGHMTAFARNIDDGSRVRQGQVIGFVGSTGLSTGSHVHYEILINGRFVDPMKIKLPRGRVLEGPLLASFEPRARAARQHHGARHARAPRVAAADRRQYGRRPQPGIWPVSGRRGELAVEGEALLAGRDDNLLAVLDAAGQDHLGQRILHRLLDHALERPRAIGRVPALVGQPFARRRHRARS